MDERTTTAPIPTRAVEDYLKAAYRLQREDGLATTRRLSQALGLSDASVTKMSKRLHRAELVCHTSYHGVVLTKEGIHLASKVLRHHRLIAMYLVETLGYGWDEASQEAERLEHHMSDQLVARIDAFLGYPALSDELDDSAAPAFTPGNRRIRL
jgi:DtxR family Mn-dependent transcriptional regulator